MATAKKSTSSKPKAAAKSPAKTQAKNSQAKQQSSNKTQAKKQAQQATSKPPAGGKSAEKREVSPQPLVGNAGHSQHAHPVIVNNVTRRSGDDALEGHFCEVVKGEHKGVFGTFVQVVEHEKDGYPKTILVKNRDYYKDVDLVTVPYSDVRPAEVGGRRSNVNA